MSVITFMSEGGYVGEVIVRAYPDDMPLIGHVLVPPTRILVRPATLRQFMAAMWWVDALVERGHKVPILNLPFLPGARQDRLNDSGDYLFTAKSVAKEINVRNFPKVRVVDPHSMVMPALIDRCEVIDIAYIIKSKMKHEMWDAVISPDAGAEKRASAVAAMLNLPLLHGWKTRSVVSGEIVKFGLEKSPWDNPETVQRPARVLVVDDICDGGGTFIGLAQILKERGITADLWTTHGFYSKGTAELRQHYSNLYCTDSVTGFRDGVTEIPICTDLLGGYL